MRRFRLIIGLVSAALIIAVLLATPAWALTITGGTAAQRALAREAIEAAWVPWAQTDAYYGGISVEIVDHYSPYWETGIDAEPVDELHGAAGLAWPGTIIIASSYAPGYDTFFAEICIHEWSHQIWFAMSIAQETIWRKMVTVGQEMSYDPTVWLQNPAENFAECMKLTWPPRYAQLDYARSDLLTLTPEQTKAWYTANVATPVTTTTTIPPTTTTTAPPVTTTTTLPAGQFTDLTGLDDEGREAIVWCALHGYVLGYPDGSYRPYAALLVRHVALIAWRAGLPAPIGWETSYVEALRGDVRTAFPSLVWDSERWLEGITRSQLARLLYRAR